MSVPKTAIDPHWVAQTLIPYLRHAFSHGLRRNHDITPYVERALDFCKTKPDFPTDSDDLLFERIFLAIEHHLKGQPAERNEITGNLEPLTNFLIRRTQLKGPYELLGRDPQPSAEWKQYENDRRANLAAEKGRVRDDMEKAQQSQAQLAAPQPTSALRSTATSSASPPLRQPSRISPRTSRIDHLIDPRLLYALPGQYTSPGLRDTLTMAEDQHHRCKNLEFQQYLAKCPANDPWWKHQHILGAATLYSMARKDSQGYQDTGMASNNGRGQGQAMGYSRMMPSQQPMVYLNPRQPWTGSANPGQLLAQQSGVVQRGLQAPGMLDHNGRRQDTAYNDIISGRPPAQIIFPRPSQPWAEFFPNSAGKSAAPVQQTPTPTANMYVPHQPVQQQHNQPTRLMEPRRTPVPLPVPSQLPQVQTEQLATRRKGRSAGLPTLTQPAGITKPTNPVPQTPRTPSCVDPSVWNTLTRAGKIQKLLDIDREQKKMNPGVKTLLEERMERDLLKRMSGSASSGTPTSSAPAFSSIQAASSESVAMPALTPTRIAFKVKGYQNDTGSTYTAQSGRGVANGMAGGERSALRSYGMQGFTNHPGFSNILSSFPPPRFNRLPKASSQAENRAGEMGWEFGVGE